MHASTDTNFCLPVFGNFWVVEPLASGLNGNWSSAPRLGFKKSGP